MLITSRDNQRIKHLSRLLSSRKERSKSCEFVVEGMRGCADALVSCVLYGQLAVNALYYVPEAANAYDGGKLNDLIGRLPAEKRFEITAEIAAKISSADTSQGIYVVAEFLDKTFCAEAVKPGGRYIVLENLQDPGNLGTVIRTADAVGIDGIVLTGNCVDLYNPKTVRSAVGSLPRVSVFVENDRDKVFEAFAQHKIQTAAAVISSGENVVGFDFSGGCAVFIGNEGNGLESETASRCDKRITISMRGNIDSLNAATAAAILLWEMTRGER